MTRFSMPFFAVLATLTLGWVSAAQAHCGSCDANHAEPCATCDEAEAQPTDTPYTLTLGMNGYSPVSYLDHQRAEPGSPRYASVHQGVTYFLASERQRIAFDKSPERYMPAYGGYCAFGCSVESNFVPDPTSFKIIDGKTHLFLKNHEVDAKALWEQGDQAELIREADAYWHGQADAEGE